LSGGARLLSGAADTQLAFKREEKEKGGGVEGGKVLECSWGGEKSGAKSRQLTNPKKKKKKKDTSRSKREGDTIRKSRKDQQKKNFALTKKGGLQVK